MIAFMNDKYIINFFLSQPGNNKELIDEILQMSEKSKDDLYRILKDLYNDNNRMKNKLNRMKSFGFR